ncbi:DUF819 family protein [Nafulsella turpanensis]|uniref:DUF819 family protein n=1 Tax=Nafulsella turpanensis TaxID=1265690 RepID=UPI0003468BF4|nr:DUF819 family protein [Nafulsella turpanensis]
MASTLLLSGFVLLFPALTLYSEKKYRLAEWVGAVVICYASGMLLANFPGIAINTGLFNTISEVSVSLAIPALLLSANLADSWQYAKPAFLSFGLCTLAVTLSATTAYFFFAGNGLESWKVSGMLIGVYTGGTPNMSAIGKALEVKEEIFILINSIDIFLSGLYFIFLMTFAQKLLQAFLPKTHHDKDLSSPTEPDAAFRQLPLPSKFKNVLISLGIAALILASAAGLSLIFTGGMSAPLVILMLTSLGLGASFLPSVRRIEGSYQTAHYLLLIFALSIGLLADFSQLLATGSAVFWYCSSVFLGAILLHYLMAAFFRIDTDTVLITSTAAIFGPAFIGPVANSIRNRHLIVAGITTGMLGYAIGNYLGLAVAYLLRP